MRSQTSPSAPCFVVLLVLVTLGTPARAQVCGDADGNGSVTVSDGVQTLRAAASLPSPCTLAICDVDGSGTITVSDAVNVLRKAADLPSTDQCGGTSVPTQAQTVLREVQPLFTLGLGFVTGTPVSACANPADGQVDVSTDANGTDHAFSTCQVDGIELDGDIIVAATTLSFNALEVDTAGAEDFVSDYDGDLTLGGAGASRSLGGSLDVDTASADALTVAFTNTTISSGTLTGGTAVLDLTDSGVADVVTMIRLTFDGSGIAAGTATLAGGSTVTFRFDLAQGVVLP